MIKSSEHIVHTEIIRFILVNTFFTKTVFISLIPHTYTHNVFLAFYTEHKIHAFRIQPMYVINTANFNKRKFPKKKKKTRTPQTTGRNKLENIIGCIT